MLTHPSSSSDFPADDPDLVCPAVPRDLVEYLEKVYPDRLPVDRQINERGLGELFGQQDVLAHLRSRLKEQEENALVQT